MNEEINSKGGECQYSKSRFCDCCQSPTTSQEASDIDKEDYESCCDNYDPCYVKDKDWKRWTKSFRLKSLSQSDPEDSSSSSEQSNKSSENVCAPTVSSCLKGRTTSTTESAQNSSSCSRSSKNERKKKKGINVRETSFEEFKKEQSEIYEMISSEKKKQEYDLKKKLAKVDDFDQSTMTQHFPTRSRIKRRSKYSYVPVARQLQIDYMKKQTLLNAPKCSPFQSDDELEIDDFKKSSRKKEIFNPF